MKNVTEFVRLSLVGLGAVAVGAVLYSFGLEPGPAFLIPVVTAAAVMSFRKEHHGVDTVPSPVAVSSTISSKVDQISFITPTFAFACQTVICFAIVAVPSQASLLSASQQVSCIIGALSSDETTEVLAQSKIVITEVEAYES